ncbi:Ig-like domain-containing protein, partial [Mongoliitalea lutea]
VSSDPELRLNPDGTITVAPNTPAGDYELTYSICEVLNPGNCDTATATVTVVGPEIIANDDDLGTYFFNFFGNLGNILDNDLLNGERPSEGQIDFEFLELDGIQGLFIDEDGNLSILTPGLNEPREYVLTYRICDTLNPSNCSIATVRITIIKSEIDASNDNFGPINGVNGGTTPSVLDNDTLNGRPVSLEDVSLTVITSAPGLILNPDGTITVAPGTSTGTYELTYSICELLNPDNCSVATISITVEGNRVEAEDDEFVTNEDTAITVDILGNDLSDLPLNVASLQITSQPSNGTIIINDDGTVTFIPEFGFSGTDSFTYQVCDFSSPIPNCSEAIVTVLVRPILVDIEKTVNIINASVGDILTYTLKFTNRSEFVLTDVRLVDLLPSELMFISSSVDPSGDLFWDFVEVGIGETIEINLDALVLEAGDIINRLFFRRGEFTLEAIAPVVVTVNTVDLAIEKTSRGVEIWEGDDFEYDIIVTNIGGTNATEVIVEDILPSGVSFISQSVISSVSGLDVTFSIQGDRLLWTVPFFPADGFLEIKLRVRANALTGTNSQTITNVVTVSSKEEDENTQNNSDSDVNTVRPFFIPNVITPNGDRLNDRFEIKGINKFVSNSIVIFNRYGDHVFQTEDYQNNWDAPGQVAGTYFYIFRAVDKQGKSHEFKGWIQVVKE